MCTLSSATTSTSGRTRRFADKVSPETLDALTRELADDIMRDADMLIAELQRIKAFAECQLAKLPSALRE